jgi:WD40 repeat protein
MKGNEVITVFNQFFKGLTFILKWIILGVCLVILIPVISAQPFSDNFAPRTTIWSPQGDRLALAYQDGRIDIVEVNTGDVITLGSHSAHVVAAAWSPDGALLATASSEPESKLYIWDVDDLEMIYASERLVLDFLSITWSPDGSSVIASSAEGITAAGNALLVTLDGLQITLIHTGISGVYWSPDRSIIASLSVNGVFMLDSTTFAVQEERYDGNPETHRPGFLNQSIRFAWRPDGMGFAIGMANGRVLLWNRGDTQPAFTLEANSYNGTDPYLAFVNALRFNHDGSQVTAMSADGTLRTWDVQSGTLLSDQQLSVNYSANFSPYGARIALGLASSAEASSTALSSDLNVYEVSAANLEIVTLATAEQLQDVAALCGITPSDPQTMIDQIDTLPAENVSIGCEADLLAVAAALQGE